MVPEDAAQIVSALCLHGGMTVASREKARPDAHHTGGVGEMCAQVSLCQDGVDHYIRTEGLHAGPAGIDQHGNESRAL